MHYTIRSVPARVDRALRERSKREGKSLNETALEALTRGLDLDHQSVRYRDLGAIAGSWVRDHEVDRSLDEQRTSTRISGDEDRDRDPLRSRRRRM